MKKYAIVILNWNGVSLLKTFLPSVCEYSPNTEIYVADNGSTDNSVQWVTTNYPQVKIIQNDDNEGFARGYNQALKQIDADVYCLLNSDVEVTPNWLDAIRILFDNHPEIAAIQPKILNYINRDYFDYAGAAGGFIDNLGYPYCRGRIFETIEQDRGQYDVDGEIFWASGACLFIRSKDFWSVDGFDEDFFAHQEEIDLCWRLQINNRKIFYSYRSVVYHMGGATLSKHNARKVYLNFRNNLYMLVKNLPTCRRFFVIILRLILDGIAGVRFLFQQNYAFCWAIIRSHMSFYKYLIHNKLSFKRVLFLSYFQTQFLPWSYYIRGKKYVSDLYKSKK